MIGAPAYSYYFVLEALAPVFEQIGTWRLIDHPESRLAYAGMRAKADGFRAVHLAINPLQDVYLSPAMPTVVFPFWEFPDIPDRDFGLDTRQNWMRTCRGVSLILTACNFTAEAFRRAGVKCPVAVVPIPLAPEAFALPPWSPRHSWSLTCRHELLSPTTSAGTTGPDEPNRVAEHTEVNDSPQSLRERTWRIARAGLQRVAPWMNPEMVGRLTRLKRRLATARRENPGRLAFVMVRDYYHRNLRRWLSEEAISAIAQTKKHLLTLVGHPPTVVLDPPLPAGPLTLGDGLVYLTVFSVGDKRKNYLDLLSSFLLAFRDRPDVTLVIKLVTNRVSEHHEAGILRARYRALGLNHQCRVVVITEFLSEAEMDALFQVATYYVNASHAEGACLPLMRALAGGRPAIAPEHSAMADYMDDQVGFVLRSFPEPTHWPHDPEERLETFRYRPLWSDLRDAFLSSAHLAEHEPIRYQALSRAARARMAEYASRSTAAAALRTALDLIPEPATSSRAADPTWSEPRRDFVS
jgi:glycosyltransferase involved in cell wall biosynthesis